MHNTYALGTHYYFEWGHFLKLLPFSKYYYPTRPVRLKIGQGNTEQLTARIEQEVTGF